MTLKFSVTKIRNCYLCRFIDNKLKLHKMKKVFTILTFVALMAVMTVQAQDRKPDWARWHYLSEEEMNTPVRNENFTETPPPTGEPRFVGEFEPMQGVMIRYPLGIPTSLVVDLSNNCMVYCITTQQSSAQSTFQNAGVNMNNVTFVNAPTDSYWVRDYGPWYIFEDCTPAIVDNRYNRPRPNDDNISQVFANYWNIAMYGMNLQHTGGNMMEDGRGHGVSDELVFNENNNNEENVRQKMREYLGIDPYHVTIDPQGDYIAHVDCWGKYLAPDKILIARLPQSNSHYNDYEQVAQYFENTNCCWGYPYQVFRVDEPGGYTLAPYTNSLILNKSVYVPMGDNATYNQQAIEVYQEAMPGYNIVPVYNNDWSIGWENTDALHCRTRGVMDFNMLFVDHREVLHGEQEWQEEYPVVSKFIAYSGMDLKQDSLLVYYSINGGDYQVAHMTATGNPDEYVGNITGFQGGDEIDYYVFGADESNHRYTQPVFAELDPHHFTVGEQPLTDMGLITETPIVELTMDNPQIEVAVTNANYASSALIAVSEIMEVDNEYLEIMPEYGLPYSLDLGESFHFIMLPNSSLVGKGTVETTVVVKSDGGEVEFHVTIDEGLLVNVTEISAETKLYPNPTSGNFTVKGADVAKVEVYNLVGQKVFETENGERRTENYIDAANWNKGIYLVNIISQNGAVETKKLVVE